MRAATAVVLRELWFFVRNSRKFWLAPFLLMLLLLGWALIVAPAAVTPFVYALF